MKTISETTSRRVFLIGMPGCGKSTVGRLLAHALGWKFVDTDAEIVRLAGATIGTIFDVEGEDGFRRRESKALLELAKIDHAVIATGGGSILAPSNRECMRSSGRIAYLRAQRETLVQRIHRNQDRPLFHGVNINDAIDNLFAIRVPLYESTCHAVIDADGEPSTKIAKEIMRAFRLGN